MQLSRRNFLKSSSAMALAGLVPNFAAAQAGRDVSFVPHAGQAGAFWGMVEEGVLTKAIPRTEIDPRPTKMISEGIVSRTYSKTRVMYPHVRKSYLEGAGDHASCLGRYGGLFPPDCLVADPQAHGDLRACWHRPT